MTKTVSFQRSKGLCLKQFVVCCRNGLLSPLPRLCRSGIGDYDRELDVLEVPPYIEYVFADFFHCSKVLACFALMTGATSS